MWYKVKDKFDVCGGLREHRLQDFLISTMQRLFRAWKAQLHKHYSAYDTDEQRLSHRPEDVELEDWKYLVKYFGSEKFKVQLQQVVVEQQPEEVEHPMTRDEILSSVLSERSGYVRGKEYGKKPPKKTQLTTSNIYASKSSAMERIRQEMQADMDQKLQEERERMAADLKRKMEEDLQKKLNEERENLKGEVGKMFQEQMAAIMTRMQEEIASKGTTGATSRPVCSLTGRGVYREGQQNLRLEIEAEKCTRLVTRHDKRIVRRLTGRVANREV